MTRMQSCRGHEFTPIFGLKATSDESSSSSEDASGAEGAEPGEGEEARTPSDTAPGEVDPGEDVVGAFADAADRWKIDASTLKGFYLHSATGELFSWEQARGLLYKYDHQRGDCDVVWAASSPQVNAEIWTHLPLPPTDPASLAQPAAPTRAARFLCVLHLSRARAEQRAKAASADFCARLGLDDRALAALQSLVPPGQFFVHRTFCAPGRDPSGALRRQVRNLQQLGPKVPWAGALESATVRVPATGSILGRCVPEIAALCWEDSDPVAPGHCRIAMIDGRFSVCDLAADEGGTLMDGRRLGSEWVPLRSCCTLDLGPIHIDVELTPVQTAASLPPEIAASSQSEEQGVCSSQRRQPPVRGGWRAAKRARVAGVAEDAPDADTAAVVEVSGGSGASLGPCVGASSSSSSAPLANEVGTRGPEGSAPARNAGFGSDRRLSELFGEEEPSPASPPLPGLGLFEGVQQAPAFAEPIRAAPRADCVGPSGTGRAFWAAPRDPSSPRSPG